MTSMNRREFVGVAAAGLASAARAFAAKNIPIAVQVYSVRGIAQKDTAGVLAKIAKIGYQGVEFAGYYGHSAQDIRKILDDNGLKAAGSHIGLETLLGDQLPKTIEFNRTIGNKNLIVPGMSQKYRSSIAAWKDTAKLFSEIAAKLKPEGMIVGYHNHTLEFQKMEDQTPFDAFFGSTSPDVKVQLDIGHAAHAGADVLDIIRRYNGRIISVHVKEYAPGSEGAVLGDPGGAIPWKDVFNALAASPGLEWYTSEEEGKACKETECIETSFGRLRKMTQ
jgi:sugar phosphate isomerase/epimerase